jgi:hypothetical protein
MTFVRVRSDDLGFRLLAGVPANTISVGAAALPSGDAALHLMQGKPGAIVEVASTVALRGVLVAIGLAVAGFRGAALLSGTAGAVLAIEAGVLAWAWMNKEEPKAAGNPSARGDIATPWGGIPSTMPGVLTPWGVS